MTPSNTIMIVLRAQIMQIDLEEFTHNLKRGEYGIWFTDQKSKISYPETGNQFCLQVEKRSFWFQHRNQCIQAALRSFPPARNIVFDVGGGNGYVSSSIQEIGIMPILVEPGVTGAENAIKRGVMHVICATLENANFIPHSLPAAGLFDVLEHISEEKAFLDQIFNLLIPGGYLYITVPAYSILWSFEDVYAGHYRRYTVSQLKASLNKFGFSTIYSSYIFTFLPVPIFLARTLPGWLGLRKTSEANPNWQGRRYTQVGMNNILQKVLNVELGIIKRKGSIPIGGSCLVVAQACK